MTVTEQVDAIRAMAEVPGGMPGAGTLLTPEDVFAAKEAFLKALRVGLAPGIRWTDVEVVHERSGAPSIVAHGRCAELLGSGLAHVTLSHSRRSAHAVVIIEDC